MEFPVSKLKAIWSDLAPWPASSDKAFPRSDETGNTC